MQPILCWPRQRDELRILRRKKVYIALGLAMINITDLRYEKVENGGMVPSW